MILPSVIVALIHQYSYYHQQQEKRANRHHKKSDRNENASIFGSFRFEGGTQASRVICELTSFGITYGCSVLVFSLLAFKGFSEDFLLWIANDKDNNVDGTERFESKLGSLVDRTAITNLLTSSVHIIQAILNTRAFTQLTPRSLPLSQDFALDYLCLASLILLLSTSAGQARRQTPQNKVISMIMLLSLEVSTLMGGPKIPYHLS